jgi:hypothetical protein
VLALAKHRKGQGKFDFKFYDKVYEDLKQFLTTAEKAKAKLARIEKGKHNSSKWVYYFFPDEIRRNNIFVKIFSRGYWDTIRYYWRDNLWIDELGLSPFLIIDDGRLEQELKNMESLRETYPWNKKHLPTIQKTFGIYEKKTKKH